MNIQAEKLWLIEHLLKIQDELLLHQLKTLIVNMSRKIGEENIEPMPIETFYARIEESEKALERGEIITQDDLRKEIETWKKR
ncbi:MAG: hypothetical protein MUF15_17920 [Acidobacteria bacterium]|jgi:hypothetical protein|nr:hypothetical protein [Acidobacteriota bacterium]